MMVRHGLSLGLAVAVTATASLAQESTNRVGAKTDWSIFVENDPTQCWVVSAPKETVNTRDGRVVAVRRGDIYMFVSFWPEQAETGEVSFMGGYPFAEDSTVNLTVGSDEFELFTDGEVAWSRSADDDRQIAAAMKRGVEATLVGRSTRGTRTSDTFSLMGFTDAYEDAQSRCSS